jgi:hypothetical protein
MSGQVYVDIPIKNRENGRREVAPMRGQREQAISHCPLPVLQIGLLFLPRPEPQGPHPPKHPSLSPPAPTRTKHTSNPMVSQPSEGARTWGSLVRAGLQRGLDLLTVNGKASFPALCTKAPGPTAPTARLSPTASCMWASDPETPAF